MKSNLIVSVALIGSIAVCAAGWIGLPMLQDPEQAVESQASLHLEQARRTLQQHSFGLAFKELLLDQLAELDVDVDLQSPEDIAETLEDQYQERHSKAWKVFEPKDWTASYPRPESARYGNVAAQIREGVNGREDVLAENDGRLATAMDYVDQALSVSVGDVSSRTNAEATRLKGIILYEMGLVQWIRSRIVRDNAAPYRHALASIATKVAGYEARQSLVRDSEIDARIELLQADLAARQTALASDRQALASLDGTIQDLEAKVSAAQARADRARENIRRLLDAGIDFTDPQGPAEFEANLKEQNRLFRSAYRDVQALRHGTYPHATIDQSGDFLRGQYVENGSPTMLTVAHGLEYYRQEREVLAAATQVKAKGIEDLRGDIARLEGMKTVYEAEQNEAQDRMAKALEAARNAFDELNRVESEGFAIEEKALDMFDRSERTLKQAAANSPRDEQWMGGHITAQAADAALASAWVHYQRFSAHSRNARVLEVVTALLPLNEVDVEGEQTKAQEARDAGIEVIAQAVADLEQSHRAANRHWTLVAQAGSANHLMALFGNAGYYDDAVEAYRNALKGREDEPYTEKLSIALRRLEER